MQKESGVIGWEDMKDSILQQASKRCVHAWTLQTNRECVSTHSIEKETASVGTTYVVSLLTVCVLVKQ